MRVAIVILNWNGADDTIECLESLKNQSYSNFHIFLLDNNSEKNDIDRIKKYIEFFQNITLIEFPSNLGFAKAHNHFFENILFESNYEYVFLLNNDTTVEPNFVESICKSITSFPDFGMISSKMINYYKRDLVNNLGHKFLNTGEVLPIACDKKHKKYSKPFINAGASGGGALYSVKMLKQIGVFDNYFETGYEDAELGIRAMICGYMLILDPSIIIYHKVGASVSKVRDYDFTLKIQLDILYTYFKLMPKIVMIINAPFYIFRSFVLLILFVLSFRIKYFDIFFKGWSIFIKRDLSKAMSERLKLNAKIKLKWYQILLRQNFFLVDNIQRFWIYFVKGQKTIFEAYSVDKNDKESF